MNSSHRFPRFFGGAILSLMCAASAFAQTAPEAPLSRGRKPLDTAPTTFGYGTKWALIVGVDYDDETRNIADRVALPRLNNAEQDARAVHDALRTLYGYQDEHITQLMGSAATKQAIADALSALTDGQRIAANDSVLIFFAGHGARIDGEAKERGAIFPYDVQLSGGRPIGRYIRLHSDLLSELRKCPARHKLLLLDSCFSGEIFNLEARPRSETDDRCAPSLFDVPAIQAIASCRATQLASDGRGEHSPFTQSLLNGLRRLPAAEFGQEKSAFWTNKLFAHMRSELTSLPNGQSPDCRNLDGDGEFYFFPTGDFSEYKSSVGDFRVLQAMVPGDQGYWWFDEMPWFIPSLRRMILHGLGESRSSVESLVISRDTLRQLADEAMLQLQQSDKPLDQLRVKHLRTLLKEENSKIFLVHVGDIAAELTEQQDLLEATDMHLLAVTQHALGSEEAKDTYAKALQMYDNGAEDSSNQDRALKALCLADMAQLLSGTAAAPRDAALKFREADTVFGPDAPAAFRIHILCREANAWLKINRWGDANRRLLVARDLATNFDPDHFLSANVHRQRAWAQMIQWRFAEAEQSFRKSNEILQGLMTTTSGQAATPVAADAPPSVTPADDEQPTGTPSLPPADGQRPAAIDPVLYSSDYDALILYLHNLHGLAMAQRYGGDTKGAASSYRGLLRKLVITQSRFRQGDTSEMDSNIEARLLSRMINSLERLADCNLLGDPRLRDVKEAVDDYRRALSLCHDLLPKQRERTRMNLLFKQALALSLPSSVQDTPLALEICAEAERLYEPQADTATGLSRSLGDLTRKVVELADVCARPDGTAALDRATAITALRGAIYQLRDDLGQNLHRDQLELFQFATKALLDCPSRDDRFHLYEDADLLLSFCRQAHAPYQDREFTTSSMSAGADSRAYLRPYYDTVMRVKLATEPKHVKDLLEIQWEATHGRYYVKPEQAVAQLALYVVDDRCYLLYDFPHGASRHYCLAEDYDLAVIREACCTTGKRLTLPGKVVKEMTAWREATVKNDEKIAVECRWEDQLREVGQCPQPTAAGSDPQATTTLKPAPSEFPFDLPNGFQARK
jgi:hypothetical protein